MAIAPARSRASGNAWRSARARMRTALMRRAPGYTRGESRNATLCAARSQRRAGEHDQPRWRTRRAGRSGRPASRPSGRSWRGERVRVDHPLQRAELACRSAPMWGMAVLTTATSSISIAVARHARDRAFARCVDCLVSQGVLSVSCGDEHTVTRRRRSTRSHQRDHQSAPTSRGLSAAGATGPRRRSGRPSAPARYATRGRAW